MSKRNCYNCQSEMPPETEHFVLHGEEYCTNCVEVKPYTAYTYYVDGEFMATSEDGEGQHIEVYEDDYKLELEGRKPE